MLFCHFSLSIPMEIVLICESKESFSFNNNFAIDLLFHTSLCIQFLMLIFNGLISTPLFFLSFSPFTAVVSV